MVKQRKKLEEELADLHNLVDVKGDEESKQSEARRMRELEIEDLRHQLEAMTAELDSLRKKSAQA